MISKNHDRSCDYSGEGDLARDGAAPWAQSLNYCLMSIGEMQPGGVTYQTLVSKQSKILPTVQILLPHYSLSNFALSLDITFWYPLLYSSSSGIRVAG